MLQLILMGLLAAGLSFAGWKIWDGFTGQYIAEGAAAQLEADRPIVEKAKAEAMAATARAEAAEADATKAVAAAKSQTDAIEAANKLASAAQAAARAASIRYAQDVAKSAERITKLQIAAGMDPVTGRTCEQVLSATDSILRESQRSRNSLGVIK
jgi:hypothetical protein